MQDGTILVTGAAGLIGNAVRVMLEAEGRADWRPEVPLEDGIRRYAAWLRQRLPA